MALTLRSVKGSPLTATEVDQNFIYLDGKVPIGAVSAFFSGGVVEDDVAWLYPVISDFKLPVDAAGSVCLVQGAGVFNFDIRKNNVSIGSITIGGGLASFTLDDETEFTNGDSLSIVADDTVAMDYVALTFKLEAPAV